MKKLFASLLILLLLAQLAAGCAKPSAGVVFFEGTASCERVNRIDVDFMYYPEESYATFFNFAMNVRKVHYIEGVDVPVGSSIKPKFNGEVCINADEFEYVDGMGFTAYKDGYALQVVEIGADYALGYLSFIKLDAENTDSAGIVDFGVMDIVLTRDGKKKYIPDDWQERLHSYEVGTSVAEYASSSYDRIAAHAVSRLVDDGVFAEGDIDQYYLQSGWIDAMKRYAGDDSRTPVERAWAIYALICSATQSDEELLSLYKDAVSLLSIDPAYSREAADVFLSFAHSRTGITYSLLISGIYAALIENMGVNAVIDMLPASEPFIAAGLSDTYTHIMEPFGTLMCFDEYVPYAYAAAQYALETQRLTGDLIAAAFSASSTTEGLEFIREYLSSDSMLVDKEHLFLLFTSSSLINSLSADEALFAINEVSSLLPGVIFPDESFERGANVACPDTLVYDDYVSPTAMEESAVMPEGRVLPVFCRDGDNKLRLFYNFFVPMTIYNDDELPALPAEVIPQSVDNADILVVFRDRAEFYSYYTHDGMGYNTVVDIYAYDIKTGEQLAYLGSETFYPPQSFTGSAGSKVYGVITYTRLYEKFLTLFSDSTQAELPANED